MNEIIKKRRTITGTVVSDKMSKTAVVEVLRLKKHKKYKKYFKVTKRFKAHNPDKQSHAGDKVIINEPPPMSKEKRWIGVGLADDKSKVKSS